MLDRLTDPRWYWVLVPAGVTAFILGCWGYLSYRGAVESPASEGHRSISDVVYGSVKLFFLHAAPQPENNVGVTLDIARFLAPLVAGWAALIALISLLRDRVQQMLIPLKRGHVVVCGLGYVGFEFVRQLHAAGYRGVVIEMNEANPQIKTCRDWGFPVIVGDAQLGPTLAAAGLKRAARLLAVTPDSLVNTEIVTRARRIADGGSKIDARPGQRGRGWPWIGRSGHRNLRCLARIDDPGLCVLLRIEESNCRDDETALDFVNLNEIGARLLLDAHPIDTKRQPHIVVAHPDALGAALIFHAARKWHDERDDDAAPLLVSVVDDQADEKVSLLLAQHPALDQVCEFSCYSASVRDIERLAAIDSDRWASRASAAKRDDGGPPSVTGVYVTAYRDDRTVETALNLRHAVDAKVPVFAALSRAYGVAELLEDTPSGINLKVFRTLRETCTVELVEGGSYESIAHEIHRRYCQMKSKDSEAPPPWAELDESLKESSRAQARHIGVKLRSIGCEITPLRDWHAKDFMFTDQELVKLAKMEHDRWRKEKEAAGWPIDGPEMDPDMVPWEDLPPDVASWDQLFVEAIPEMLAAVGLQIVDVDGSFPRYPNHQPVHFTQDPGTSGT